MSIRLRELIRAVRATKTAAEEREVIAKESAALREAFREQEPHYRHRNVAKLMYIHMLGYPTHFGQMETLKLIAASRFAEKRIGYLGLMILLDERQEVLMLVTNSLKMDLNNTKNQYTVGLALAALGNICSAEMARDLAPDVEKLIESTHNPYIRRKAALCAIRVLNKVPELLESFEARAPELLTDKNQGVMLCGTALMLVILTLDPSVVPRYRRHVPSLCKILKSLQQSGSSAEYDVGAITNPFLQVKVLRLLRLLGKGNAESSDIMSDILAQVAANTDGSRNAGNAILYECVQTIMGIESIGGLRVLAINILGKFLANRDNNIRYVALNTLAKVVTVDTQAVQRHRNTIVDCVKDADVSIRRRALELVYSLVNEANIRNLTRELLEYLSVSDAEFKPDLTAKICMLIQRFAPDKRWHIDNLLAVMVQAGAHVKEDVCRALIVLITNAPDLQTYAVRSMYRNLSAYRDDADVSLVITALWCIGEFGEMLLPGQGSPMLDGEPNLTVSDTDIVSLLEAVSRRPRLAPVCKEFLLTAAMKLTARLPAQVPKLRAFVERHSRSVLLEVQNRSCEYTKMFKFERIRPQLLERMPALDEVEYANNLASNGTTGQGALGAAAKPAAAPAAAASPAAAAPPAAAAAAAATPAAASGLDLLDLHVPNTAAAAGLAVGAAAAAVTKSAVDVLDDLLGGGLMAPTPAPAAPAAGRVSAAGGSDLMDLLGGGGGAAAATAPSAASAPQAAAPQHATSFPRIVAWQKDGLSVQFAFAKPPGNASLTEITATYTSSGPSVSDFNLQAAVPKFMQLRLEPASGTSLSPASPLHQKLYIHNTQHGVKALIMRLRIAYTPLGGAAVLEQGEVTNFPAGL